LFVLGRGKTGILAKRTLPLQRARRCAGIAGADVRPVRF
jgi:hypothetical protein